MILTAILYILYYAIYAVLSVTILLFSDVVVNPAITTAISTIISYVAIFNSILPVDTIFQILASSITIFLAVSIYRIVLWVIKLIRG